MGEAEHACPTQWHTPAPLFGRRPSVSGSTDPILTRPPARLQAKASGFAKPSLSLAIESAPVWLACSIGALMRAA